MSFTGIQATIDFYTVQEANITNELTDIMTDITQATKKISSVSTKTSQQRESVKAEYPDCTSVQYKNAMDDIESEYETTLADITAWETELQTQKDSKQTELQATRSYLESFKSALKENIQKDFKYGGSSSS